LSVTNEGLSNRTPAQNDMTDKIGHTAKSSTGKTEARNNFNEKLIIDNDVSRETSKNNSVDTSTLKISKRGFQLLSMQDKALYLALYPVAYTITRLKCRRNKAQKAKMNKVNLKKQTIYFKNHITRIGQSKLNLKNTSEKRGFKNKLSPKVLSAVFLAVLLYVAATNIPTKATLVAFVDGQKIGAVKSVKVVELAKLSAEQEITSKNGYDYRLPCKVTYDIAELNKPQFVSNEKLQEIFGTVSQKELTNAVGLYIDGNLVAVSSKKEVLENALNESLKLYEKYEAKTKQLNEKYEYGFANNIEYAEKEYPKSSIMNDTQVRTLLGLPKAESQKNDNSIQAIYINSVAENSIIQKKEIQISEPQTVLPTLKLSAHSELTTSNTVLATQVAVPAVQAAQPTVKESQLNYSIIKNEVVNEVLPYKTINQDTDKLLSGQTFISQKGVDGLVDSTYKVEYVEGKVAGRTLVDQKITKETIPMIVLVGTHIPTKEELATMPTGTYILPYKGKLTSTYGWRNDLGYREFHAAWDICGPLGSSVVAIDGGTVIFTGNESGYGNYVMIDHGNNLVTLYAHLKSISVKVGNKIGQGGEVGKMGCTGNATGVHVHLEIRKNNVTQNPQDYLPKP